MSRFKSEALQSLMQTDGYRYFRKEEVRVYRLKLSFRPSSFRLRGIPNFWVVRSPDGEKCCC